MSTTIDAAATPIPLANAGIQSLGPGTYVSTIDGFACGMVNGRVRPDGTVSCWIRGNCGATTRIATGGLLAILPDGCDSSTVGDVAVGPSFTLPVPANTPFTLAVNQSPNTAMNPVVSLTWVPMG